MQRWAQGLLIQRRYRASRTIGRATMDRLDTVILLHADAIFVWRRGALYTGVQ